MRETDDADRDGARAESGGGDGWRGAGATRGDGNRNAASFHPRAEEPLRDLVLLPLGRVAARPLGRPAERPRLQDRRLLPLAAPGLRLVGVLDERLRGGPARPVPAVSPLD